jgi:hypothetical protein
MTEPASRRSVRAESLTSATIAAVARRGRITDLPADRRRWFRPVDLGLDLDLGTVAPEPITMPQSVANRLLKGLVRFVVDVPPGTDLDVVWELGSHELLVHAGSVEIDCRPGLASMSVSVTCDQLGRDRRVTAPFALGTPTEPRGLYMSSLTRLDAPAVVAEAWSDSIVAFCWEALLEVARRVSADAGDDARGRPLIPGAVACGANTLVVHPMARHDLRGLAR